MWDNSCPEPPSGPTDRTVEQEWANQLLGEYDRLLGRQLELRIRLEEISAELAGMGICAEL